MTKPLHFVERIPEPGITPVAALLLLHGIGSNEHDLVPIAMHLGSRFHVVSFRAPLSAGAGRYMWYPMLNGGHGPEIDLKAAFLSREALIASIRQYRASHSGVPVYLLGFSQGAALSLITALTKPGEVDGVMCFSGRFPREFATSLPSEASPIDTTFWVSHGREDTALPIAHGRAIEALLRRFDVSHVYREFEGGHEITHSMIAEAKCWLDQQLEFVGNKPKLPAQA